MKHAPKIVDDFGGQNLGRADYKDKMKHFPVKFCPTCKRAYEGPNYLEDFPTIGLERRECFKCKEAAK